MEVPRADEEIYNRMSEVYPCLAHTIFSGAETCYIDICRTSSLNAPLARPVCICEAISDTPVSGCVLNQRTYCITSLSRCLGSCGIELHAQSAWNGALVAGINIA